MPLVPPGSAAYENASHTYTHTHTHTQTAKRTFQGVEAVHVACPEGEMYGQCLQTNTTQCFN